MAQHCLAGYIYGSYVHSHQTVKICQYMLLNRLCVPDTGAVNEYIYTPECGGCFINCSDHRFGAFIIGSNGRAFYAGSFYLF